MEEIQFKLVIELIVLCLYDYIERKNKNCAYAKFERVNSEDKSSFSIRVSVYDIIAFINTIVEICIEMQ